MDLKKVPVFILCGGLGTRIKEETEFRPKPMVPIDSHPVLWHVMHTYSKFGFRRFVLCTGFKSEVIKSYFLNYASMNSDFTVDLKSNDVAVHSIDHEEDWEVTVAYTGELTMTGARIAKGVEKYLGDAEHFAVTYGDGLTDAKLDEEFAFHVSQNKIGTVLGVNPPSRFGELRMQGHDVLEFSEKPDLSENWINGGYFFFKRDFASYLSKREDCILEKQPLIQLAKDRQLSVFKHDGFWACMDTQRDREMLSKMCQAGNTPWLSKKYAQELMNKPKKVLVTGHRGYIGVHLVDLLLQEGHEVTGCDLNLFGGCEWESFKVPQKELRCDVRDLTVSDLKGYDCVMHLAAISNDPMGELDPSITIDINRDASIELAKKAKAAGVKKFLFASSCSIYGQGETLDLDETAKTAPLSAYAKSKIEAEIGISELADETFCPVYLRNATAYGHSPMLRIDLVANNLLGCALSKGDIRVMSDGSPWRPLIHCRDIARAFVAFMHAPTEKVFNLAVNVGGDQENYQVRQVVEKVQKLVPEATVVFTGEVGADPRNYRVKFSKLKEVLPDFELEYTLEKGLKELHEKYQAYAFNKQHFESAQFVRLKTLLSRLKEKPQLLKKGN